MNYLLFCSVILCLGRLIFAEEYAPSDGYEKCKVDQDCAAETCPPGQVSLCDVDKEECMCQYRVCDFVTCQNEGQCVVDSNADLGFNCHCQTGYDGDFCQNGKCVGVDCNNGDCVHEVTLSGDIIAQCQCQDGWVGDFCDEQPAALSASAGGVCQFVSCQNGGVCEIQSEAPGFSCACAGGFSGAFCQDDDVGACTLDSDCTQSCDDGKAPFCSVPTFSCNCKSASSISCATHHDCSSACDATLGLCMADGLCDCFHGMPNYFAHMIINKFPDSPPFKVQSSEGGASGVPIGPGDPIPPY